MSYTGRPGGVSLTIHSTPFSLEKPTFWEPGKSVYKRYIFVYRL